MSSDFNFSLYVNSSFQYTKSSLIDSYPYMGYVTTYPGGGYFFKMNNSIESIQSDLEVLKSMSWIDSQTRAVFLEFNLYNPSLNLFQSCIILFEINAGGSFVITSTFTPIDLNEIVRSSNEVGFISVKILLYLIYIVFVCILFAKEVKDLIKTKWQYFRIFYNYIDLLLIIFTWSAFSMYLYRLYTGYHLKSLIKDKGYRTNYINLQFISAWNQVFIYFIGMCIAFGTIRFLKLLRFNKRIMVFLNTFKFCGRTLVSFSVVFCIYFFSFAQVFYLLYNSSEYKQFSSLISSAENCFLILLGLPIAILNDYDPGSKSILGPILFFIFAATCLFVWINIFITILNDAFALSRIDKELDKFELGIFMHIKSVIFSFLGIKEQEKVVPEYTEHIESLPKQLDMLLSKYMKVIEFFLNFFFQKHL